MAVVKLDLPGYGDKVFELGEQLGVVDGKTVGYSNTLSVYKGVYQHDDYAPKDTFVHKIAKIGDTLPVAVKVESSSIGMSQIQADIKVCRELYSSGLTTGITPPPYFFGWKGEHNGEKVTVAATGLLGPNVEEVFMGAQKEGTAFDTALYVRKMVGCVEAVHDHGYRHGDIKPANFCVANDDQREVAIIDFGIARRLSYLLGSGARRGQGTAPFMALSEHMKEKVGGDEDSDSYSDPRLDDLESVGYVLLYFLMGGSLPWDALAQQKATKKNTLALAAAKRAAAVTSPDPRAGPFMEYMDTLRRTTKVTASTYADLGAALDTICTSETKAKKVTKTKKTKPVKKKVASSGVNKRSSKTKKSTVEEEAAAPSSSGSRKRAGRTKSVQDTPKHRRDEVPRTPKASLSVGTQTTPRSSDRLRARSVLSPTGSMTSPMATSGAKGKKTKARTRTARPKKKTSKKTAGKRKKVTGKRKRQDDAKENMMNNATPPAKKKKASKRTPLQKQGTRVQPSRHAKVVICID